MDGPGYDIPRNVGGRFGAGCRAPRASSDEACPPRAAGEMRRGASAGMVTASAGSGVQDASRNVLKERGGMDGPGYDIPSCRSAA